MCHFDCHNNRQAVLWAEVWQGARDADVGRKASKGKGGKIEEIGFIKKQDGANGKRRADENLRKIKIKIKKRIPLRKSNQLRLKEVTSQLARFQTHRKKS